MRITIKHLSLLLLLSVAILIVGCTSVGEIMQTWHGNSTSNLVGSWGPPDRTFEEGNATWYVYEKFISNQYGARVEVRSFKVVNGLIVGHTVN